MPLTHQEWISLLLRNRGSIKGVSLGLLFNDVTYEQKTKKKKRKEKNNPNPPKSSDIKPATEHLLPACILVLSFPFHLAESILKCHILSADTGEWYLLRKRLLLKQVYHFNMGLVLHLNWTDFL